MLRKSACQHWQMLTLETLAWCGKKASVVCFAARLTLTVTHLPLPGPSILVLKSTFQKLRIPPDVPKFVCRIQSCPMSPAANHTIAQVINRINIPESAA
jgi:hypothetical protein